MAAMDPARQQSNLERALRSVNDSDRAMIAQFAAQAGGVFVKTDMYYSRFRIPYTVTTAGSPVVSTLSLAAGTKVLPFQYAKGDLPAVAGFPASFGQAKDCDTNLLSKGSTNNQELMLIQGVGVHISPETDPELARRTWPHLYVSFGFGGDENTYRMGPPGFWPGAGGLSGGGLSNLLMPNMGDTQQVVPGFTTNGQTHQDNYRKLQESVLWSPVSGGSDTNLTVSITAARAISFTATARTAGTGIAAVTPPAATDAAGTFVEGWVQLFGLQFAPRSKNR
jgi:hypothetical protein